MSANKVTLRVLAGRLAPVLGVEPDEAERRLRAYFGVISAELEAGNRVQVKGLGEFLPGKGRVTFIPDEELAEAVNAPFNFFAPVSVIEEVATSLLEATDINTTPIPDEPVIPQEESAAPEPAPELEPAPGPEPDPTPVPPVPPVSSTPPPSPVTPPEAPATPPEAPVTPPAPKSAPVKPSFPDDKEEYFHAPMPKKEEASSSNFPTWVWILLSFFAGMAVGFGLFYFTQNYFSPDSFPTF